VARDDSPRHILVVDDDPELVAVYRELLEDEGFRVSVEPSPDLLPATILAIDPELILVDLLFAHEPHGFDLVARLKSRPATRTIPVLVCSADSHLLEELSDQLLAWDCGVLLKPFSLDALLKEIAACLASSPRSVPRSISSTIPQDEEATP
jgi:DNA-binding response OmpR family regulator